MQTQMVTDSCKEEGEDEDGDRDLCLAMVCLAVSNPATRPENGLPPPKEEEK